MDTVRYGNICCWIEKLSLPPACLQWRFQLHRHGSSPSSNLSYPINSRTDLGSLPGDCLWRPEKKADQERFPEERRVWRQVEEVLTKSCWFWRTVLGQINSIWKAGDYFRQFHRVYDCKSREFGYWAIVVSVVLASLIFENGIYFCPLPLRQGGADWYAMVDTGTATETAGDSWSSTFQNSRAKSIGACCLVRWHALW